MVNAKGYCSHSGYSLKNPQAEQNPDPLTRHQRAAIWAARYNQ